MILDDLFEQRPLPAHIKASDLPPAMRSRLTMKDVEKERPRGAFRYRVTPGKTGESPKDFLDLPGAEQYAQATGGRVQPLEEQADPDVQRGIENLDALERNANNDQVVMIQNETGRPEYQIEKRQDKQWVINHAKEWVDAGRTNDLYRYMGTTKGFDFLLVAWQKEDAYRSAQSKRAKFEPDADTTPDLYGAQAKGTPRAPRYQDESASLQKKTSDLEEAPQGARGRTERMMSQMRARQPQATSDLEALAYELQDAEKRDAQEINKLEQEVDNLESDVKQELQKRIATLTKRKGGVQQAAAQDVKTDDALAKLAQVNVDQQREINNLEKAVASLGQRPAAAPTVLGTTQAPVQVPAARPAAAVTEPKAEPAQAKVKSISVDQPQAGEQLPQDLPQDSTSNVISPDFTAWKKQKVAEGPLSALGTLGRAITGKTGPTPFRDLTAGEKLSNKRAMIARSAQALGNKPEVARQQQAMSNISKAEQAKVTKQIADMAAQIRQANQAGDIERARQLQRQFDVLRTRAALLKGEQIKPSAASAASPGKAPFGQMVSQLAGTPGSTGAAAATVPTAPAPVPAPASTPQAAPAPVTPVQPQGWKMGQPITIGKQTITSRDPQYKKIAQQMTRQGVKEQDLEEKKRPQPTNPDLWSRAKSAARSKFDVYPSAYANAWAAKWYKSKGGGWRMGKPKKK